MFPIFSGMRTVYKVKSASSLTSLPLILSKFKFLLLIMSLKQLRLEDHYHAKGDNEILINYFYSIHDRRKRDKSMQM